METSVARHVVFDYRSLSFKQKWISVGDRIVGLNNGLGANRKAEVR